MPAFQCRAHAYVHAVVRVPAPSPQAPHFCFQPNILAWRLAEMLWKKDAKPTGSSVSYLNTDIHNSFTIFYNYQDPGEADVGEFLETPSTAYVQPQPPYITLYKSLVRQRQPRLPFSSFSVQDLHSSMETAPSLPPLWLSLVTVPHFHLIK